MKILLSEVYVSFSNIYLFLNFSIVTGHLSSRLHTWAHATTHTFKMKRHCNSCNHDIQYKDGLVYSPSPVSLFWSLMACLKSSVPLKRLKAYSVLSSCWNTMKAKFFCFLVSRSLGIVTLSRGPAVRNSS